MESTPFMDLVLEASDYQPLRRIARETEIDHTRLRRMMVGETPWKAEVVLALARRYNIPFGVALEAAGWVTADEARLMEPTLSLQTVPDKQLLGEVMRRIESGQMMNSPLGASVAPATRKTRAPRKLAS